MFFLEGTRAPHGCRRSPSPVIRLLVGNTYLGVSSYLKHRGYTLFCLNPRVRDKNTERPTLLPSVNLKNNSVRWDFWMNLTKTSFFPSSKEMVLVYPVSKTGSDVSRLSFCVDPAGS